MPENTRREKIWITAYIAVELLLLIAAKICESAGTGHTESIVKFSAIVCNTIVAAYYYIKYGRRKSHPGTSRKSLQSNDAKSCDFSTESLNITSAANNLIAYGLFCTVVGDFFLTLISTEKYYLPGIVMFCAAELLYMIYLRPSRITVVSTCILLAATMISLIKLRLLTVVTFFGALDIVLILINTISAWASRSARAPHLFRIGITLFLCCDVSLMLRAISSGSLYQLTDWLFWTCYAPSQVLITLAYIRDSRTL